MRRKEFKSSEDNDFDFVVQNAIVGYLGLNTKTGYPRIVPLNFVAIDQVIYFHGAKVGGKYDILMKSPKVSFSIDIPYSFIPSHFESKKSACPATHFFKSIHIRGVGLMVNDIEEKAVALNKLMIKYQPEGQYLELSPQENIYKKPLLNVAVFKIDPEEVTMKMKFGQNLSPTQFNIVLKSLEDRGEDLDFATITEMKKRYTHKTHLNEN
ncbi:MAG: hypothetical protein HeimC2_16850 [Candidatus Heimdallarchaeota archaeon LC_2]|nr:MAG: hypothetical protein HeimC2_16850 [Candidatus Heimdallarchaeota archaeon LC_2]